MACYNTRDNESLLVCRKTNPGRGKFAFPGGFIIIDKEDLYQTAVRELEEETGIKVSPQKLHLIDVRSHPKRDPRLHVIDVGFLYLLSRKGKVLVETKEGSPQWLAWKKVDKLDFAFDHRLYWQHIKNYLRGTSSR